MEHEQYLYDEFIAEAREHLSAMEEDFLALERERERPDFELVDKVFRAIHSIKGGAAFLGLTMIKELAHAMETLLSLVRSGGLKPERRVVEALLAGVDDLSAMVKDPERSNDMDIGDIRERLETLLADVTGAAASPAKGPEKSAPASGKAAPVAATSPKAVLPGDALIDPGAHDLAQALTRFDYIYFLRYDLREMDAHKRDFAKALKELMDVGEILDARLEAPQEMRSGPPAGPLRLDALFATIFAPDMIEDVTELTGEHCILVAELKPGGEAPAVQPIEERQAPLASKAPVPAPLRNADRAPAAKSERSGRTAQQDRSERVEHAARSGAIRVNVDILDKLMTLAGELVLVRNQQLLSSERLDPARRDIVQRLDMVTSELQSTIMRTRMQPIGNVLGKLPRIVRDLSADLGKEITLDVSGSEVELDKTILESLADPLTHIIRNCCDHGVETPGERERLGKNPVGRIAVKAYHEAGQIMILISDDGRGIDPAAIKRTALERSLRSEAQLAQMSDKEILSLILLPGFSTARSVSAVSGRGVGMDVVKHSIEDLGGSLDVDSWLGQGTKLQLRLPLTLAIIPSLIVTVSGRRYAIPQINLVELVCLYDEERYTKIEAAGAQEVYRLRDRLLPMVRLSEVLARREPFTREFKAAIAEKYRRASAAGAKRGADSGESRAEGHDSAAPPLNFAVVKVGADRFGLIVDTVQGAEEIVVKPMHPALKSLKCYSGATVMGDGAVSLILDIEGIARHAGVSLEQLAQDLSGQPAGAASKRFDTQSILLFKSGEQERFALSLPLIRRIERVSRSRIESVGRKDFLTVDGVTTLAIRLENHLSVSPCLDKEDMFLLLPKFAKQSFGILISSIIDIVEAVVELNVESYVEDGLMGTAIVQGHMTLFPDIHRLVELAEPKWFIDRERVPAGEKRRVLLVEDSSFFQHMVRRYLETDAYEVLAADNGKEALELMGRHSFDMIVSDIEMPIMNGLDFIRNVRLGAHGVRQRDLPALALTSLNTERDRAKALACGFDEYQVKMDRERFLGNVAALMHTKHAFRTPEGCDI